VTFAPKIMSVFKKTQKNHLEVGFFRRVFLGFIGRVFLGGFFIANPGSGIKILEQYLLKKFKKRKNEGVPNTGFKIDFVIRCRA
jgi:hypothetical protein